MGADGAKGCVAVADAGGRFIAQDEATSVVWGMPGAAAATGRTEDDNADQRHRALAPPGHGDPA